MGHSPVQGGMSTDMRGVVIDAVRVSIGASGAPTLVDNGKTGLIASVVRNSAGLYTFQLNKNYYKSIVAILPKTSAVAGNTALAEARYVEGSYSATAGTFQVVCSSTAPAAVDPVNGVALDLVIVFQAKL